MIIVAAVLLSAIVTLAVFAMFALVDIANSLRLLAANPREKILQEVKDFAARHDKVSMADVMRIIREGK